MARQNEMDMDDDFNDDDVAANDSGESSAQVQAADDDSYSSEAARRRMREAMAAEVEAFLSRGGRIQQIEDNVMADPPRKPQTSYGSRPI